ncbi:MAG TPA: cardiolipin synthase [Desulfuromonas sp.]|nr:cardiolipin synthase [Desulfuromonas sp.]HBT83046.1 cardiolipin synthase [Desulfuromonas sp.]
MFGWFLFLILIAISVATAGHALLEKRDPRSALGWVVLCLALPGLGAAGYWLFGVNRIRNRARRWQARGRGMPWLAPAICPWAQDLAGGRIPFRAENFAALLSLADAVTRRPLLQGNHVDILHNGEEAYPAMLAAIDRAESSVCLATYIFDNDASGRTFATALKAAAARGATVRVLLDALGACYSWPRAYALFAGSAVRVVKFLPFSLSERGFYVNMRNHRKLLVVDGSIGFTGGMNIGDRHLVQRPERGRVVDLHFRVSGPVVGQMHEAFLEDWHFASGEAIKAPPYYPDVVAGGEAFCRGISAGPNEDFEKLVWIVIGALNCARRRVRIMTPYFIPDRALMAAINAAALRGVEVEIMLPRRNNLPVVGWASRAYLGELLEHGCRVYYQPAPFVHSKFLLVDDDFALIGSANLDPRSLRLNFEFNLEVYDRRLTRQLAAHFNGARERSRAVTPAQLTGRSLGRRLLDGAAKLFSPYL